MTETSSPSLSANDAPAASALSAAAARRTGDLVTRDEDGYRFLVGRLERMINALGRATLP